MGGQDPRVEVTSRASLTATRSRPPARVHCSPPQVDPHLARSDPASLGCSPSPASGMELKPLVRRKSAL